jgi:hypothetical protein
MQTMSKKPGSKDEALEALDFIVNVLKEHEKDLDRLINELGTVTDALGETGELTSKVEKVEERINGLQNEINGLVKYLSSSPRQVVAPVSADEPKTDEEKPEVAPASVMHGPPVILRCKQWEDFQTLASQAQTLSFMYKDAEKTFQADALKGNQIVTYSGELPKLIGLLKIWLSKQLDVPERKILEGVLAIG